MNESRRILGGGQVWYVRLMHLHSAYRVFGCRLDISEKGGTLLELCLNLTMANATIGGCFRAKMTFPPNYPLYPPKMKFETPIFHPNGKPAVVHAA